MPVPTVIAAAADNYRMNTDMLTKMVSDLSPEEWLRHPDGNVNHIAWIVGHVIWTRERLLARLGREWPQPWLELFGRGAKCGPDITYPSHDTLLEAWRESSTVLENALENVTDAFLAEPSVKGPPSTDGKQSGVVNFLAIHETYHLGQISYLRGWLGHKGLMG
jgi:uncharacterized damage-inducible protein DinB